MPRKKKVLVHSNSSKTNSGFGKHMKNLLCHLYKTGKYDIVELANAEQKESPKLKLLPWKALGTMTNDPSVIKKISRDPEARRNAGYGHELIDEIVFEEKPDVYIGIEDIWAFDGFTKRSWWNKPTCIIQSTLDSLPLLPQTIEAAPNIKNFWTWASFAEKEMKKSGFDHVKTVRGIVDHKHFFRMSDLERKGLRKKFRIKEDEYIVGFVFRNQLRKSVPNLLEGFRLFLQKNPGAKAKLLLHTHWSEGWSIPTLLKEKGIDPKLVLTTYYCSSCGSYEIKSFEGEGLDCPSCGGKKTFNTTSIRGGVDEKQLNEIYNLMDVYCHPFTSGGQEIPIQEAKLTELITLVTNYSCGEDMCEPEAAGLALDWSEYREPGTQFIKASTCPKSIAKNLEKVFSMKAQTKRGMGKKARQFVIDNFSVDIVGSIFEEAIDSAPFVCWENLKFGEMESRNPDYIPREDQDDPSWLLDMYHNMLKMYIDQADSGYRYWISEFQKGASRKKVYDYFKSVAKKENKELFKTGLKDLIVENGNPRLAYVVPEHAEDVLVSLGVISSLKKTYPEHDIYFFTKPDFFPFVDEHPDIFKTCEYDDSMEDVFHFEGRGDQKDLFDLAFLPYFEVVRTLNYTHHGKDKVTIL